MRKAAVIIVLVAACGGEKKKFEDAAITVDDSPIITADAPPQIACTPQAGTRVTWRRIGGVTGGAMLAVSPPGDGRLFVVEQAGRIRIFENDMLKTQPFLDIQNVLVDGGEQGLLGLAFHPKYAQNNLFYVFYTTQNANVVARYQATSDPNIADAGTAQIVLSIPDFAGNHNGGMIQFGKDGYLYIGTGDGGSGNDPRNNGQQLTRNCAVTGCEPLLAKILRIDVDNPANGKNYGIPATNPFAGQPAMGEPEIFAWGLRNPWRWAFDPKNDDVWIGDVGQNADEEMDYVPAGQLASKNFGWRTYEATRCTTLNGACTPTGFTMPQVVRNQAATGYHAIIGGQVYRGPCYPDLDGTYFFTDNTANSVGRATVNTDGSLNVTYGLCANNAARCNGAGDCPGSTCTLDTRPNSPASIHNDSRGELYMTTTNGSVYHLEAAP